MIQIWAGTGMKFLILSGMYPLINFVLFDEGNGLLL